MKTKEEISDIIYDYLDWMYCDNCRYSTEIESNRCEDCHRKSNGWALSRDVANAIAGRITNGR